MAEEQVLVVERKIVEQEGIFHGLNFDVEPYLRRIFAPGVLRFVPRSQAESDTSLKQLIPYVIMTCQGKCLNYVRGKRAGEKRLVGNRSIGIGGHINPIDNNPLFNQANFCEMYLEAVEREVAEEVDIDANHQDRIVALLNDDSNEVGKVHLGIVHYWTLDAENVTRKEQMITQMSFMEIEELRRLADTMETWSSICLAGLEQMEEKAKTAADLKALLENT
jgi:predicted NUDIX family phosphoesterase